MIEILNTIIESLGSILGSILSILPDSPFQSLQNVDYKWLQLINYFFPVTAAVAHLELFVSAVGGWFVYRVIARWIKLASS